MLGIRIQPLTSPPIPHGRESFEVLFHPALKLLEEFHWIIPANAFRALPDTESVDAAWANLEGKIIDSHSSYLLLEPGALSGLARYIHDDWTDLFCFARPVDDLQGWIEGRFRISRAAFLEETVDVLFISVDSAYWLMYSRLDEPMAVVREHLGALPGIDVIEEDLRMQLEHF
jgi:hypothetical protein